MPATGPRELLEDPYRFGYRDAKWKAVSTKPQDRAEVAAAYAIHKAVLVLRRTLTEEGLTQTQLAKRIGVKPDYLGRRIRGEGWATLQDLMAWSLEFGVDLLPAPGSSQDLLP